MKLLVVSDIHLHDYPQRNPSTKFRLRQSKIVANNIIEVARMNNIDRIVIAGDVIEKSVIRSYIQTEVKRFLDTLMDYFVEGYIIYGNHDLDNKGSDQKEDDCVLSVMLPRNLHYVDEKVIPIGGSICAFSNWKPKFDLSWINSPVDVLFSHATIAYNVYDMYKSQYLDQSKFNIAILGDIHKPAVSGKFISIGCPQKCKMGDSDKQTGVIYDTDTKEWSHVDLNPHDNLLKFKYTSVRSREGYDDKSNTYLVYKPSSIKSNGNRQEIQIPQWEEINNLINDIIVKNGLSNIHGNVLSNIKLHDEKEVDFNFTLMHLVLNNFRSISDCDIYFDEGDKILITGENGNGKSSLLLGLKYALLENRFLKDFVQFDTDKCEAIVELLYQNKSYKILRGSKDYGLWINGEQQKYNNKREFEEDVHKHLPFIDYMDIYFFSSETSKIIGSLTPERKSDIISKFFKLDRIDLYNSVATSMFENYKRNIDSLIDEVQKCQELGKFIDTKVQSISLPNENESKLRKRKSELLNLQERYFSYIKYDNETSRLGGMIESYKSSISNLEDEIRKINISEIEVEIFNINQKKISLSEKLSNLRGIVLEKQSLKSELDRVVKDGTECYTKLSRIKNNICPTCGQKISNDKIKDLEESLSNEMTSLLNRKSEIESKLSEMTIDDNTISDIQSEIGKLEMKLMDLYGLSQSYKRYSSDLDGYKIQLDRCISDIEKVPKVDKVELPDSFQSDLNDISSDIQTWESYSSLMKDKNDNDDKIMELSSEISKHKEVIDEFNTYIKLTGPTGKIYEEIMNRLATEFSDNIVKYEVNTYKFRGKDHLDLSAYYNVKGRWVAYQSLSSGQTTVTDINFLSKIVTRMGLLVMDEFLKHLSPANHDICIDILSRMNVGCIMLSSHMESITSFNNKTLELSLNDSGITTINMK